MSQKQAKPLSEAEKILAKRILARRRLLQFVQLTHGNYDAGWVHDDICRRLEKFSADVAAKKSPRLMLLMPPRHGKSELASIRFPGWHLGQYPEHEMINVGYNMELPMIFSRKVRELARDPMYQSVFPGMELNPDSQSIEKWNTTKGGGFTAAGVGGGITGKGCFRTSTRVHTRNGILPISDVRVGDEVLGYDHAEQRPQWTRVLAVHAGRLAGPARKHGSIWCTPDHELFVPGRGYVPAGEALAQGLPILRWEESSARCVVSSLSDGAGAGDEGSAGLRAVQQPVPSSGGRAHQAHGSWGWEPHVLFGRVFPGLAQGAGHTATRLVRELQRAVGEAVPAALLFAGVLPRSATAADGVVQRGVSVVEEAGAGARRASVRDDGQDADARGAPYRPRPYEQRADEPYFSLEAGARVLSFTPGWSAGRVAELVRGEGEVTVDLQTTAGNLFVEGVLAHNCHILIIDDPIKNQEEADSIEVRNKLLDWYQSTAYTRLAPGGGILLIQTWWNDDDLAGRLQNMARVDPSADQFEVIKYPALSEAWEYRDRVTQAIVRTAQELDPDESPDLELLRPIDTCLHEARYPTDSLKRIRANLQPRIWSALYQQNPMPDEGVYFRKQDFRYYITPPRTYGMNIFTAWDFAIGEKQQNDWTVGFTVLQDESNALYVLEVVRFKGDSLEIADAILDAALRFGTLPNVNYSVGMEDGQIFRAMKPMLELRMTQRKIWPAYEVLKPFTDKLARARTLQGRMQQGRVFWPDPKYHGWVNQAVTELLRFPGGANDDVVDGGAWAAIMANSAEPPQEEAPKPVRSWKDGIDRPTMDGSHMTA